MVRTSVDFRQENAGMTDGCACARSQVGWVNFPGVVDFSGRYLEIPA